MLRKETILIADNFEDHVKALKELLENRGYNILVAFNPSTAKTQLEKERIDLAVLDIRLENDEDENDISGLLLARDVAPDIPKVMLTAFPTWQAVTQALGPRLDGLPPAVDFVAKSEGPEKLLDSIEWILNRTLLRRNILNMFGVTNFMALPESLHSVGTEEAAKRLAQSFEMTRQQLFNFQQEESKRAAQYHFWALVMSIFGMLVIISGVILSYLSLFPHVWIPSIASVLLQAISLLFFREKDKANKRIDRIIERLDETNKLANLLTICDTIPYAETREEYKLMVIQLIIRIWFSPE